MQSFMVVTVKKTLHTFLHTGDLDKEVHMKIPQDFAGDGDLKVYCLCKSLYILQQTSRGTKSSQVKTIFLPTRGCLNVVAFCNTDLLGCNFTRQSQNKLYYAP